MRTHIWKKALAAVALGTVAGGLAACSGIQQATVTLVSAEEVAAAARVDPTHSYHSLEEHARWLLDHPEDAAALEAILKQLNITHQVTEDGAHEVVLPDGVTEVSLVPMLAGIDQAPVVINAWFDEQGMWPRELNVPAGRQVQLVLRNYTSSEHHYHILGMATNGMRWLSKDGLTSALAGDEIDHEAHHTTEAMLPFHICTSRSGICPTGEWVHAHTDPADRDLIIFVAAEPGRYSVVDPLDPELSATVVVF